MRDKMRKLLYGSVIVVLLAPCSLWGRLVPVPSEYGTIQKGLDYALQEDTLWVAPGTYYERIVWPDRAGITLMAAHGPDSTVIDGGREGSVVSITTGVDSTMVIQGLTIQGGKAVQGGGIHCVGSSPVIRGNVIVGNHARYGGGIYSKGGSPIIENNVIQDNKVKWWDIGWSGVGAGIYCEEGSPVIRDNEIVGNWAQQSGGGIECFVSMPPPFIRARIEGNIIRGNYASEQGAGISTVGSSSTIRDNVITDNQAEYAGGGLHIFWATDVIEHNVIRGNWAGQRGAGICSVGLNHPTVQAAVVDNEIVENVAVWNGGGMYCAAHGLLEVRGNTIADNRAGWGGGILCEEDASPRVEGNILTGNVARYKGGALYVRERESWPPRESGVPVLYQNHIQGNQPDGICSEAEEEIDARENWWGDPTGPSGQGSGNGQGISENVLFAPWLQEPPGLTALAIRSVDTEGVDTHHPWEEGGLTPRGFHLAQNVPNPFNLCTAISYTLPREGEAQLSIYDLAGQLTRALTAGYQRSGPHEVIWDGRDDQDQNVANGVYVYRLRWGDQVWTKRMVLLK